MGGNNPQTVKIIPPNLHRAQTCRHSNRNPLSSPHLVMQSEAIIIATPLISQSWLLFIYCAFVMLASLAGGWLLLFIHLTHTRLQTAISFVAGLMLGIALLHFLPDANEQLHSLDRTAEWMLGGFLAMFFVQRFFHFHHHDLPEGDPEDCCGHDHDHDAPGHEEHAHTLAD